MTQTGKRYRRLALMFGAYMFLHTTTLLLGNRGSNGYISGTLEENLYYIHLTFMIAGFLSFALLYRKVGERKGLTLSALIALAGGIALLYTVKAAWVFVGIGSGCVYCLGYLGGLVYRRMSAETAAGSRTGLIMGVGCGAAYTLQYFLEGRGLSPVLPAILAPALFGLGYVLLRESETQQIFGCAEDGGKGRHTILCVVIISAGLVFFNSFYNGYMHHLQIQSNFQEIDAYAWPRLMLVPVYLAFGFLGDVRHGKFVPIAALCTGLVTLLHAVLSVSETAYWINMCLFYVSIASSLSYCNIAFWRLAAKTRQPAFWASAGRIIDALVVMILGIAKFSALPVTGVLLSNIMVLAVVIVTMAANGDLSIFSSEAPPAQNAAKEDALKILKERYAFTPAEMKVLRELVQTDDKQAKIAERLSIKLGTVQYHATNIYRKAEVINRAALRKMYRSIIDE